ncbi:hypothetical protein [Archangium primigenium]|uniref:hypothetical protein n=1 Tax=[Archangium] primigenium TaxID=2792470 RepID=UPI00195BFABE|nr:hypothetical protein [Archangium primigenium]MBM7116929.1 hypothetical protein [Archangium primigenium]
MDNPSNRPLPPVLDERWNTDDDVAWPGNVPSRTQALEALRDRQLFVRPLPRARRVRERLSAPERAAVGGSGFCPLLREATVVRWRLAAAADLLPAAGSRRSAVALRALLVEVNQMTSALRAARPPSAELALALDAAGEKLNAEVTAFLRSVKAVAEVRRTPPRRVPRLALAPQPPLPPEARRWSASPLLSAALVLTLTVAAMAALQGPVEARAQGSEDSAPDAFVTPHAGTGALLVRSTLPGPETEAQRAWLRFQEAKGMRVTMLGPGSYLVAPALRADASGPGPTMP